MNKVDAVSPMMMPACSIGQNFPNPCNDETSIRLSMTKHDHVTLRLYDMLGRLCSTVLDENMGPGEITVPIRTSMLETCGVYVYRLQTSDCSQQRIMEIMR